jgi:adenine-specific DNA-methyltransferase
MTSQTASEFSGETLTWLERTDLRVRQTRGQYMTPRSLRTHLLRQLHIRPGDRVLDPAVGTGEFLRHARELFPGIETFGWDIDESVLETARLLDPKAALSCRSGLDDYRGEKFDFVIGNPPYFEVKLDETYKEKFRPVLSGRPNIYGLFFKVGLDALKDGGTLAYVVPPSMNAGAYFRNLRRYLTTEGHIVSLKVFDDSSLFIDAQTAVQVIVIRKGSGPSKHTFFVGDERDGSQTLIFCENPSDLARHYEGSVSLASLGYEAVTGTTVWNQHKDKLTNVEDSTTVPLIYARNIIDGEIALSPDLRRPQYIRGGRVLTGEAIVVNRILGGVGKGAIKAALIPRGYQFAAENHLNVIRPISGVEAKIPMRQLYELITDASIVEKARVLTGNTQLSATEWTRLMPFHYEVQA